MDTGGKAIMEDGNIVIRVPIDAMQLILDGATCLGGLGQRWLVTDAAMFAKEVCRMINSEDERGTTRFHRMFDRAMDSAIADGAEGVEEHPKQEF